MVAAAMNLGIQEVVESYLIPGFKDRSTIFGTVIEVVIDRNDLQLATELLEDGALSKSQFLRAIEVTSEKGMDQMVALFLKHSIAIDETANPYLAAISGAVRNGQLEQVNKLADEALSKGVLSVERFRPLVPNQAWGHNIYDYILVEACIFGQVDILRKALEEVNPAEYTQHEIDPDKHEAVWQTSPDEGHGFWTTRKRIRWLGFSPNKSKSSWFNRGFQTTIRNGHLKILEELLTRRSIKSHMQRHHETWESRLHGGVILAVQNSHAEILQFLIGRGAKVSSFNGSRALKEAIKRNDGNLVKILRRQGAKQISPYL
jgi:hypothetical protein